MQQIKNNQDKLDELLVLMHENNIMLKELIAYIRKMQNPEYTMPQDINDFVMNVVANLIADDIEGINGNTINR